MESSNYYKIYIAHQEYKMLGVADKLGEVAEAIEESMKTIKNGRYLVIQRIVELNMDSPFGVISNPQELLELKEKAALEEQKEKSQREVKDDVPGRVKVLH